MGTKSINWVKNHKWAITESALQCMMDLVENVDISSEHISKAIHGSGYEKYLDSEKNALNPMAVFADKNDTLEGARRVSIVGRTAIVPVVGPIFARANFFSMFSGATSLDNLSNDFNAALKSDLVDSIILNIDSPGGEVTGISEFSKMVFDARNSKRVSAHIFGFGASAAYWIASAAGEIVINETAEAGSIGVVAGFTSTKEADEKKGIKRTEIVSSQSPNKRVDIESNEGKAQMQTVVDDIASVFVSTVARNRGVSEETVMADFGQGKMFVGKTAVENGLADRLGDLESLIADHNKTSSQTSHSFLTGVNTMDKDELKAKHPATYQAILEEGKTSAQADNTSAIETAKKEGATAENTRLKSIEAIDAPGMEKFISEKKFEMTETKESISAGIIDEQSKARKATAAEISEDGEKLGNQIAKVGADAGDTDGDEAELAAIVSAGTESANQTRN